MALLIDGGDVSSVSLGGANINSLMINGSEVWKRHTFTQTHVMNVGQAGYNSTYGYYRFYYGSMSPALFPDGREIVTFYVNANYNTLYLGTFGPLTIGLRVTLPDMRSFTVSGNFGYPNSPTAHTIPQWFRLYLKSNAGKNISLMLE